MQIVIDISEEKYNKLVMEEEHIRACGSYYPVMILDGTPLPKGHGRLIDADCVIDAIDDWMNEGEYRYTNATDYLKKRMRNIQPIIEADKAESEEV